MSAESVCVELCTCVKCLVELPWELIIQGPSGKHYCRRCYLQKTNPPLGVSLDEQMKKRRANPHDD
jgi:hypothetical protein